MKSALPSCIIDEKNRSLNHRLIAYFIDSCFRGFRILENVVEWDRKYACRRCACVCVKCCSASVSSFAIVCRFWLCAININSDCVSGGVCQARKINKLHFLKFKKILQNFLEIIDNFGFFEFSSSYNWRAPTTSLMQGKYCSCSQMLRLDCLWMWIGFLC